jgi:hypothetical protein
MKVLAAAVATGGAVAAVAVASAGGQAPLGRTIVLLEQPKGAEFAFVDNPPHTKATKRGEPLHVSGGDLEAFSATVTDQQGAALGFVAGQCTIGHRGNSTKHRESCTAAFRLKDGIITVATALAGDTGNVVAAITGGTGAYNGARGTLTSVTGKDNKTTDTLELLP